MSSIMDKENISAPLFLINGSRFLSNENAKFSREGQSGAVNNPGRDYVERTEQLVDTTRNAEGKVIAQVINRRLSKFDNLTWPYLSAESVTWLKQQIANFDCKLTYWDSGVGSFITRDYYWGDFEATPCEWEVAYGPGGAMKKPKYYKEVKCNLIDKGY